MQEDGTLTPRCLWGNGTCLYPVPKLDQVSDVALSIFMRLQTQWAWLDRAMDIPRRIGIPRERVKIVAEARGFYLNDALLKRIEVCEGAILEAQANEIRSEKTSADVN